MAGDASAKINRSAAAPYVFTRWDLCLPFPPELSFESKKRATQDKPKNNQSQPNQETQPSRAADQETLET